MDTPVPRFFESENKVIAYMEWEGIRLLCFDGKHMVMADAYPQFEQRFFYWIEPYSKNSKPQHHTIMRRLKNSDFSSLGEFYEAIKPLVSPKPRGKMLRDKKKRTAQEAYQREKQGDAFIDNKALISAAKKEAQHLSEIGADAETIAMKAAELVVLHHDGTNLTQDQINLLCDVIQKQIDKHQHPNAVEAKIIDANDKNLYFMWGKIKRQYPVNDTFAWTSAKAVEECRCSKSDVGRIMKKLCTVGALTLLQAGRAGKSSRRASIYRREV